VIRQWKLNQDAVESRITVESIYLRKPGGMIGLMAAKRLRALDGEPALPAQCVRVGELASEVPESLRAPAPDRVGLLELRVDVAKEEHAFAEPIELTLELTNRSALPVGLAPEGAITRFRLRRYTTALRASGSPGKWGPAKRRPPGDSAGAGLQGRQPRCLNASPSPSSLKTWPCGTSSSVDRLSFREVAPTAR